MKHDKIIVIKSDTGQQELPQMHWTIIDDLCALTVGLVLFGAGFYHYG